MTLVDRKSSDERLGHSRIVSHNAQEIELGSFCHLRRWVGPVTNTNQSGGNVLRENPSGLMDQGDELVEPGLSDKEEQVAVIDELGSRGVKPYPADVYHRVDFVKVAKAICQSLCQVGENPCGCFAATGCNQSRQVSGERLATRLQPTDRHFMSSGSRKLHQ